MYSTPDKLRCLSGLRTEDKLRYVFAIIATPIAFILNYMVWVCMLGAIASFLTWDWSIIPNNLFPWEMKEPNIIVRSVSGLLVCSFHGL